MKQEQPFKMGDRVVLLQDVERFPHAIVAEGATGTVAEVERGHLAVVLDDIVEGLEEWDNWLIWCDTGDADMDCVDNDIALLPRGVCRDTSVPASLAGHFERLDREHERDLDGNFCPTWKINGTADMYIVCNLYRDPIWSIEEADADGHYIELHENTDDFDELMSSVAYCAAHCGAWGQACG